jgi:hypothetical protein
VKPFEFPLLTDENISPDVVAGLRERDCDVRTVADESLIGSSDLDILERAGQQTRVVVTHDLGFGQRSRPSDGSLDTRRDDRRFERGCVHFCLNASSTCFSMLL